MRALRLRQLPLTLFVLFVLSACGGSGGTSSDTDTLEPPPISDVADGSLTPSAGATNTFTSNLTFNVSVSDADGLKRVYLTVGSDSENRLDICTNCGNRFNTHIAGLNPGFYGARPGAVLIQLWVVDAIDTTTMVAERTVDWAPPVIEDIQIHRSGDGTAINVQWQPHPQLLRYNVYIASEPGVSGATYQTLDDGQARLAVEDAHFEFSELNPNKVYYLLLTGVDSSGESTFNPEITVTSDPNITPIATDDTVVIDEDQSVQIMPLVNDVDADGDTLSITQATTNIGTLSFTSDAIDFMPPANVNGTALIEYRIADGNGGSATANIEVIINPVNDAPIAEDDETVTPMNTPIDVLVLANDSDVDGDTLLIESVSGGEGTVSNEDGEFIRYTPMVGFIGVDSFTYVVIDNNGGEATATVTVSIQAEGDALIANNDFYEVSNSGPLTVGDRQGVLANDVSVEGSALSVTTTPLTGPSHGDLVLASDGSFSFQPDAGFEGSDTFDYELIDNNGMTASARVTLKIETIPTALRGESDSISSNFVYTGIGESSPGSGIGRGLYQIGECSKVGDTVCTFNGTYSESSNSGNAPLSSGRYSFVQRWSGTDDSPVIAESQSPGSVVLTFSDIGDAVFELSLYPESGGIIRAFYPDVPFSRSIGFGAFIQASETCVGLPAGVNCDIGQVGLHPGAVLTSPLSTLEFTVPGVAYALSGHTRPEANDDVVAVTIGETLFAQANTILANDSDSDTGTVADQLQQTSTISPSSISQLVALAFDQYRQQLFVYSGLDSFIQVFSVAGDALYTVALDEQPSNKFDIDVAPEAFTLNETLIARGTLLLFNGMSNQIQAIEPIGGAVQSSLLSDFGDGYVVGGAYNEVTDSLFLLQNGQSEFNPNTVAEVDPRTGKVLNSFSLQNGGSYDVMYGDIEVNTQTGNLYLLSSSMNQLAEFTVSGEFVRHIALSQDNSFSFTGMGMNQQNSQIWLSSTTGEIVQLQAQNNGRLPQWHVETLLEPQDGEFNLHPDGRFEYTPSTNFSGQDRFIYRLINASGRDAVATVILQD